MNYNEYLQIKINEKIIALEKQKAPFKTTVCTFRGRIQTLSFWRAKKETAIIYMLMRYETKGNLE